MLKFDFEFLKMRISLFVYAVRYFIHIKIIIYIKYKKWTNIIMLIMVLYGNIIVLFTYKLFGVNLWEIKLFDPSILMQSCRFEFVSNSAGFEFLLNLNQF